MHTKSFAKKIVNKFLLMSGLDRPGAVHASLSYKSCGGRILIRSAIKSSILIISVLTMNVLRSRFRFQGLGFGVGGSGLGADPPGTMRANTCRKFLATIRYLFKVRGLF